MQHSLLGKRSFLRIWVAMQSDNERKRNYYLVDVFKIHNPCSLQWTSASTIISVYGQCKIEQEHTLFNDLRRKLAKRSKELVNFND